jgi:hypothetical protein
MSKKYRMAFRETLFGKGRNYHQNNGFSRDQSSFRETTIGQENSQLVSSNLFLSFFFKLQIFRHIIFYIIIRDIRDKKKIFNSNVGLSH